MAIFILFPPQTLGPTTRNRVSRCGGLAPPRTALPGQRKGWRRPRTPHGRGRGAQVRPGPCSTWTEDDGVRWTWGREGHQTSRGAGTRPPDGWTPHDASGQPRLGPTRRNHTTKWLVPADPPGTAPPVCRAKADLGALPPQRRSGRLRPGLALDGGRSH